MLGFKRTSKTMPAQPASPSQQLMALEADSGYALNLVEEAQETLAYVAAERERISAEALAESERTRDDAARRAELLLQLADEKAGSLFDLADEAQSAANLATSQTNLLRFLAAA